MPFDSGNASFLLYRLDSKLPDNLIELFSAKAAKPLEQITSEDADTGWTGRHLLDITLSPYTCHIGDFVHLHYRSAQKKVSPALLKAECLRREYALREREESSGLSRKRRQELRENAHEDLLKRTQPTISGFPCAIDPDKGLVYLGTSSGRNADNAAALWANSIGSALIPVNARNLGGDEKASLKVNPITFCDSAPAGDDVDVDTLLGRDFLTWIWYRVETEQDIVIPDIGVVKVGIDGPLTFVGGSGHQALESVLRKGAPSSSPETQAALLAGRKLRAARLSITQGETTWNFTFDADTLAFRSVKLPDPTVMEPKAKFEERMEYLATLVSLLAGLHGVFIHAFSGARRAASVDALHQWVRQRAAAFEQQAPAPAAKPRRR